MYRDYRQSRSFQELNRAGGVGVVELCGGDVAYAMSAPGLPWLRMLVAPYIQAPEALELIDDWSREHRPVLVSVVPHAEADTEEAARWRRALEDHRYSVWRAGSAPTRTLLLDLDRDADGLLGEMKEKTRYNIGLAKRRGVTAAVLDGRGVLADAGRLDDFYSVYQQNCLRIGTKPDPPENVRQFVGGLQGSSFAVYARGGGGATVAVALFVVHDGTAVYELNGSTEDGRKDFGPTLAIWEGILEAKRRGCARFDFGGTFDDRFHKAQEKWKGFSQFKSGFGGRDVKYVGSFVKWLPFLRRRRRSRPGGRSDATPRPTSAAGS